MTTWLGLVLIVAANALFVVVDRWNRRRLGYGINGLLAHIRKERLMPDTPDPPPPPRPGPPPVVRAPEPKLRPHFRYALLEAATPGKHVVRDDSVVFVDEDGREHDISTMVTEANVLGKVGQARVLELHILDFTVDAKEDE